MAEANAPTSAPTGGPTDPGPAPAPAPGGPATEPTTEPGGGQPQNAPPEDRPANPNAFMEELTEQAVGDVPSDPSDYWLPEFGQSAGQGGGQTTPQQLDGLRRAFHVLQIPQDTARALVRESERRVIAGHAPDAETDSTAAERTLRGIWGSNYERNLELANSVLDVLNPQQREAFSGWLKATGLGNDPKTIMRFAHLAQSRAALNSRRT